MCHGACTGFAPCGRQAPREPGPHRSVRTAARRLAPASRCRPPGVRAQPVAASEEISGAVCRSDCGPGFSGTFLPGYGLSPATSPCAPLDRCAARRPPAVLVDGRGAGILSVPASRVARRRGRGPRARSRDRVARRGIAPPWRNHPGPAPPPPSLHLPGRLRGRRDVPGGAVRAHGPRARARRRGSPHRHRRRRSPPPAPSVRPSLRPRTTRGLLSSGAPEPTPVRPAPALPRKPARTCMPSI